MPKKCVYSEDKQAKLREAVRLIMEVVDDNDLRAAENGTEMAGIDAETEAVLRLVAVVIEDEMSKHTPSIRRVETKST